MGCGNADIDKPCPRLDACTPQVCLEAGSFQYRRGFPKVTNSILVCLRSWSRIMGVVTCMPLSVIWRVISR